MKISKVNHTRTGTYITDERGSGMLYKNPAPNGQGIQDLSKHIDKLNESAKRLYSPFSETPSSGKAPVDLATNITKSIKSSFKNVVLELCRKYTKPVSLDFASDIKNEFSKQIQGKNVSLDASNQALEKTIKSLKKSLCKSVRFTVDDHGTYEKVELRPIMCKFIEAMCTGKTSDISDREYVIFINAIVEDYYKADKLEKIKDSIEKKDIKVQVTSDSDDYKLALSNYDHPKKHFVFDFIKEYADADEKVKEQMIIRIRRLILLYVCGRKCYELSDGADVGKWTFGSCLPESQVNFDESLYGYTIELEEKAAILDRKNKELANIESKLKNLRDRNLFERKNIVSNEIKATKSSMVKCRKKINDRLSEVICNHYREATSIDEITDSDRFWLMYFETETNKFLGKKGEFASYRLGSASLCDKLFKIWISFIASKYVDMGKAVYHFAMPLDNIEEAHEYGVVLDEFKDGITSFDYERIKAEDDLSRDIAVQVTFSASTFANASTKEEFRLKKQKEDPLQYGFSDWEQAVSEDAERNLLAYFGGQSQWVGSFIDNVSDVELADTFGKSISKIRNANFHYAAELEKSECDKNSLIYKMFEVEYKRLTKEFRKKYLSNNVPKFYSVNDINKLMVALYKTRAAKAAQVPSFNAIVKRKDMPKILKTMIDSKVMASIPLGDGTMEQLRSSIYFLLKDIYYYGFLKENDCKERFVRALEKSRDKAKNPQALDDFLRRVRGLEAAGLKNFGEICQAIMTDYNQQNQGNHAIKSQIATEKDRANDMGASYEHFRMLLYKGLKDALLDFVEEKSDLFGFIWNPSVRANFADTDNQGRFLEWDEVLLEDLVSNVSTDATLLDWYVMAHFINSKANSHLQGSIRSYKQFVLEINRREANALGKTKDDSELLKKLRYQDDVLGVLEFVMMFAGNVSNVLTDYFADEDAYAMYLSNFVGIGKERNNVALQTFCSSKAVFKVGDKKSECQVGIYHNGMEPIVNRNLIYAKLYGTSKTVTNVYEKVSVLNICNYYSLKSQLSDVFARGICKNKEEQDLQRQFQMQKNRIELTDASIFSEMINDYMAALVNLAFLRERDLLYYQLGFYYLKLFWGNKEYPEEFNKISAGDMSINRGAMLYEIAALYTYNLPILTRGESGAWIVGEIGNAGKSYKPFVTAYSGDAYEEGLELFEDVASHGYFIDMRNDLDHMKYFIKPNTSILELFSKMYNGFFAYDNSLKKSVSYIFTNIAEKYFVNMSIKVNGKEAKLSSDGQKVKPYAEFVIKEAESDMFTFKTKAKGKDGKEKEVKYQLPVRGETFIKEVKKLLQYKEK